MARRRTPRSNKQHGIVFGNGDVYCVGYSAGAALGQGIPNQPAVSMKFSSISAGSFFNCGVADGRIYCWGHNESGQLGNLQSVGTDSTVPVEVPHPDGLEWSMVSCGFYHACALDVAGRAYCWGKNTKYQLGIGSSSPTKSATPLPVAEPAATP